MENIILLKNKNKIFISSLLDDIDFINYVFLSLKNEINKKFKEINVKELEEYIFDKDGDFTQSNNLFILDKDSNKFFLTFTMFFVSSLLNNYIDNSVLNKETVLKDYERLLSLSKNIIELFNEEKKYENINFVCKKIIEKDFHYSLKNINLFNFESEITFENMDKIKDLDKITKKNFDKSLPNFILSNFLNYKINKNNKIFSLILKNIEEPDIFLPILKSYNEKEKLSLEIETKNNKTNKNKNKI